MYDSSIQHWEIKSNVVVGHKYFRVNTIQLLNGKYETAVMPSNEHNMVLELAIYFYNQHATDVEAIEFNRSVTEKMNELNKKYVLDNNSDILSIIEENIKELNRYNKSVAYQYPEDLFGEKYQQN